MAGSDGLSSPAVMPGLVPGIHAAPQPIMPIVFRNGAAWMAGTSPAMTGGLGKRRA
jgi:hypothetical protein